MPGSARWAVFVAGGLALAGQGCPATPVQQAQAADAGPAPAIAAGSAPRTNSAQRGGPRFLPASSGDVAQGVRAAMAEESARGRRLLVYVGATWCEPCGAFHRAVEQGELPAEFADLTLLEFDLDRDAERLKAASYAAKYIPLFAVPAPDGTASGRQIEGAVKGEAAVAVIVPRLARLLTR